MRRCFWSGQFGGRRGTSREAYPCFPRMTIPRGIAFLAVRSWQQMVGMRPLPAELRIVLIHPPQDKCSAQPPLKTWFGCADCLHRGSSRRSTDSFLRHPYRGTRIRLIEQLLTIDASEDEWWCNEAIERRIGDGGWTRKRTFDGSVRHGTVGMSGKPSCERV